MKKHQISRFIVSMTTAVCCLTCMTNTSSPAVLSAEQENSSLMVFETHTPEEICEYINNHPFDTTTPIVYAEEPSLTEPYSAGKLSDETLQETLNSVNVIRYICGLQEVTLNDEYNEKCQVTSLVNALNGTTSHFPEKPSGISDELYTLACDGASNSNLFYQGIGGFGSTHVGMPYTVLDYMDDSDAFNISCVGHRRWVLNPVMKQTGFGCVIKSDIMKQTDFGNVIEYSIMCSSMYAHDNYKAQATEKGIVWPALNTPVECFNNSTAWSISIGTEVNISDITVTVTDTDSGQEWNFTEKSSDGDFYVDNQIYGQTGCIIFRPDGINCDTGTSYDVHIDGLSEDILYTVNFFSLKDYETSTELLGDINADGKVSADDMILLQKYILGEQIFTETEYHTADINADGAVDSFDMVLMRKKVIEKE